MSLPRAGGTARASVQWRYFMIAQKLCSILSVSVLVIASSSFNPVPAAAAVAAGKIVVVLDSGTISSTSLTDVAIVTNSAKRKSYIESYFQTASGQAGLHIESRDQRRI